MPAISLSLLNNGVFLIQILNSEWKLEIFKMKALLFCIPNIFILFPPYFFYLIFNKGFKKFGVVHVATGINKLRFMHLKPQILSQNMFSNIVLLQRHSTFNTFDPLGLFILLKFDSAKLNPLITFCKTTHFMSGYKPIHLLSRIINSHLNMPVSTTAAEWKKKLWWLYRNALNFYGMLGEYQNNRVY